MRFRCKECGHQIILGKDLGDAYACKKCGKVFHEKKAWEKKAELYLNNSHFFWYGLIILSIGTVGILFNSNFWTLILLGAVWIFSSKVCDYFGIE